MMYEWKPDMVRFMNDACAHSQYFSKLADIIEPSLNGAETICDAGCGLGHLSFELARRGYTVYACDINPNAIKYIEEKGIKNIVAVQCNLKKWTPEKKFDAIVFNYFGSMEETLEISKRCCSGVTVAVKKNYKNHRFSLTEQPIEQRPSEEVLRANKISYTKKEISLELGQPFRSLEDAVLFYSIYSCDTDKSLITAENIRKKLVLSTISGFEYYLPHIKDSVVFTF